MHHLYNPVSSLSQLLHSLRGVVSVNTSMWLKKRVIPGFLSEVFPRHLPSPIPTRGLVFKGRTLSSLIDLLSSRTDFGFVCSCGPFAFKRVSVSMTLTLVSYYPLLFICRREVCFFLWVLMQ